MILKETDREQALENLNNAMNMIMETLTKVDADSILGNRINKAYDETAKSYDMIKSRNY